MAQAPLRGSADRVVGIGDSDCLVLHAGKVQFVRGLVIGDERLPDAREASGTT